jgi:hypothetical protein
VSKVFGCRSLYSSVLLQPQVEEPPLSASPSVFCQELKGLGVRHSSAVKEIIRCNFVDPTYLARELEKLLSHSAKLRCTYSTRLTHETVEAVDRNI